MQSLIIHAAAIVIFFCLSLQELEAFIGKAFKDGAYGSLFAF
jgi:hypothetical protein